MAVYKLYKLTSETPEEDAIEFTDLQEAVNAAAELLAEYSVGTRRDVSCVEDTFAFAPGEPLRSGLLLCFLGKKGSETPFAVLEGVTFDQFTKLCPVKPEKIEKGSNPKTK